VRQPSPGESKSFDSGDWQDKFAIVQLVLQKVFDVFGGDLEGKRGKVELPPYHLLVRQKELFSANLSYKNLSGEQILAHFAKKLVPGAAEFKQLLQIAQSDATAGPESFESAVRKLLESDMEKPVDLGWSNRFYFTPEE